MAITEKVKIYKYVYQCAYQRRYNAMKQGDWELYHREHETILMCLNMKDAKWTIFDSEKPKYSLT